MPEDINADDVIAQLQRENERLRETIAKIKLRPAWFEAISWYKVKALLSNPYFIIGYIIGALFALMFCFGSAGKDS
jgi:hypothetical protein